MSLSFQMLMKKAAAQTQSAQREAADLLAQRDAAQKKAREEQEAREAKEREARKARILYELETARKAEEEALRKLQKEKDRLLEGRPDVRWTPPKTKAPSSVQNRTVRQVQETSDKSRSSSPRPGTHPLDRSTLSREEKRALANPLLRGQATTSKPKAALSSRPVKRPGGPHASSNMSPARGSKPYASARDRIAAEHLPNKLIVLNTVKKDMRTIDEITRDLERQRYGQARVELVGPDATGFTDWFGKSKNEREKQGRERELERERAEKQKLQQEAEVRARELAGAKKTAAMPRLVPVSARIGQTAAHSKSPVPRPTPRLGLASAAKASYSPSSASAASKATSTHTSSTTHSGSSPKKRPHPQTPDSETDRRKFARLQLQSQQRHRAPDPDDYDSELVDDDWEEEEGDGGTGTSYRYVPGEIAALLGRDIQRDAQRELSSSGSELEDEATGRRRRKTKSYGYEELMREERRSAMLAKKEDEEEEARLKKHEQMKRQKKAVRMREMLANSNGDVDDE